MSHLVKLFFCLHSFFYNVSCTAKILIIINYVFPGICVYDSFHKTTRPVEPNVSSETALEIYEGGTIRETESVWLRI